MSKLGTISGTLEIGDTALKAINGEPISEAKQKNIYAQTAAIAADYTSKFGPIGLGASITAASAAGLSQAVVIEEDRAKFNQNPTLSNRIEYYGDIVSGAGDSLQLFSLYARLDPAFAPVAVDLAGIAKGLEVLGLALSAPGYVKDVLKTAGTIWLDDAANLLDTINNTIQSAILPGGLTDDISNLSSTFESVFNDFLLHGAASSDVSALLTAVRSLKSDVSDSITNSDFSQEDVTIDQPTVHNEISFNVLGDDDLDQKIGISFKASSDSSFTETINPTNNTSQTFSIDRDGTEVNSFYRDQDATDTLVRQDYEFVNGSSASIKYNANGSSLTKSYAGISETGSLEGVDAERANGTSALTTYDDAGNPTTTVYSGPNGTGNIIGLSGGNGSVAVESSITTNPSFGTAVTTDYSGPNGTGIALDTTTTSITSVTFDYTGTAIDGTLVYDPQTLDVGAVVLSAGGKQYTDVGAFIVVNNDGSVSAWGVNGTNGAGGADISGNFNGNPNITEIYSNEDGSIAYSNDNTSGSWSEDTSSIVSQSTTVGLQNGAVINCVSNDVITGAGTNDTFVFSPIPGNSSITDFVASGSGHDMLSLPSSDFASIAQVLASSTTNANGDAVLNFTPSDSLTLSNISLATLKAHPGDFVFH